MSISGKSSVWALHIISVFFSWATGLGLGVTTIFAIGRPSVFGTTFLTCLLLPYFFIAIACLCVGIRFSFLNTFASGIKSLSVVYESYSAARTAIDEVSRAIVYPAMMALILALYSNWVVLEFILRGSRCAAGCQRDVVFVLIFLSGILLSLLVLLTYPSYLIDKGDLKMRELVVHSDDREDARVLACLFLDGDDSGIRFLGILFDKDMLTFWSRAIYIMVSYTLTQTS